MEDAIVVDDWDVDKLNESIEQLVRDGYVPQGGVSVSYNHVFEVTIYVVLMIKN